MDFIIRKGTELFHSTGEPFSDDDLRVGAFDKVLWTAMESAISQAYIPRAGAKIYATSRSLWYPTNENRLKEFQKKWFGFEYEDVKIEHGRVTSWRAIRQPVKWSYDFDKDMNAIVNRTMTSEPFNYEPERVDQHNGDHHWKLYSSIKDYIVPSNSFLKGRLFILIPKRDLKLFDFTHGGSIDGDLNDRDYYKIDLFRKLEAIGYDGVRINDHAQTEEFGNFGHLSYGLFHHVIKDLKKEVVNDVQHPMNLSSMYGANKSDWQSDEYKRYRKISKTISEIIRKEFFS